VFLGANQDAIHEGAKLGINKGASLTYAADNAGTSGAFASASHYVGLYSAFGPGAASFSEEDRKAQERLEKEKRKQKGSKS
jgi:hypothetical protein